MKELRDLRYGELVAFSYKVRREIRARSEFFDGLPTRVVNCLLQAGIENNKELLKIYENPMVRPVIANLGKKSEEQLRAYMAELK